MLRLGSLVFVLGEFFGKSALQPHTVHFQLLAAIDLQPTIHFALIKLEIGKQFFDIFFGKEIALGTVSTNVAIV